MGDSHRNPTRQKHYLQKSFLSINVNNYEVPSENITDMYNFFLTGLPNKDFYVVIRVNKILLVWSGQVKHATFFSSMHFPKLTQLFILDSLFSKKNLLLLLSILDLVLSSYNVIFATFSPFTCHSRSRFSFFPSSDGYS